MAVAMIEYEKEFGGNGKETKISNDISFIHKLNYLL
jgi:hypothetical protein|tara:strand:+ start:59 stop:166 length:108 start_codon:yes stop_codon:yes gene_type:complete